MRMRNLCSTVVRAGVDWVLVSSARMAVVGENFVVDANSAWDTSVVFLGFIFIFDVIM